MNAQSWRVALACSAFSLGLMASPLLVDGAAAQQATLVDPQRRQGRSESPRRGSRRFAQGRLHRRLDLAKKAAAAGQPLDAEQVEFISGKAEKQQAVLDAAEKNKASQAAAAATAQQILDRQQKDYAAREKKETATCTEQTSGGAGRIGTFTSAAGAAASSGGSSGFGAKITGADDSKKKCSS